MVGVGSSAPEASTWVARQGVQMGGAVWEDGDEPSVGVTVWGRGWGELGSTYYFSEGLLCGTLGH